MLKQDFDFGLHLMLYMFCNIFSVLPDSIILYFEVARYAVVIRVLYSQ